MLHDLPVIGTGSGGTCQNHGRSAFAVLARHFALISTAITLDRALDTGDS